MTDDDGAYTTCQQEMTIAPPCVPPVCCFAYAPPEPTTDDVLQLTDCSTQAGPSIIVSWAWTFGDGGISSEQHPAHQYAAAGTYQVCLTVTNDCEESTMCCQQVVVILGPTPVITCPDPGPYSVGGDCTVPCPAGTAIDDVDPDPTVTQSPAAGTPLPPGDYVIGVRACDSSGNCSTTECPITVVDDTHPNIWCPPDVAAVSENCDPIAVDIGLATASDNCDPSPVISNDAPELFASGETVVTWMACDATGNCGLCTQTVTVDCPPTGEMTYDREECTAGGGIDFGSGAFDPDGEVESVEWDFGDGTSGSGENATHVYDEPGLYEVCVMIIDDEGLTFEFCEGVAVGDNIASLPLDRPCWHMVTIPCQPVVDEPRSVFCDATGAPIPIDGALHRYDHDGQRYVTYWDNSPTEFGPIKPGDGYWLWLFEPMTIGCAVICEDGSAEVYYPTTGWYLTGSGVIRDVYMDDSLWWRASIGPSRFSEIANLWVQDPLVYWSCPLGRYLSCGLLPTDDDYYLRACRGYWLYTFVDDITLEVPAP